MGSPGRRGGRPHGRTPTRYVPSGSHERDTRRGKASPSRFSALDLRDDLVPIVGMQAALPQVWRRPSTPRRCSRTRPPPAGSCRAGPTAQVDRVDVGDRGDRLDRGLGTAPRRRGVVPRRPSRPRCRSERLASSGAPRASSFKQHGLVAHPDDAAVLGEQPVLHPERLAGRVRCGRPRRSPGRGRRGGSPLATDRAVPHSSGAVAQQGGHLRARVDGDPSTESSM